jgi:WD40 repeat protein
MRAGRDRDAFGSRVAAAAASVLFTFLAFAFAWAPSSARAETRIALVVANASYADAPLRNPIVDAGLVGPALEEMGFDVTVVENADLGAFVVALERFYSAAKGADIALFYFAGHGFALNSPFGPQNYLMSTSADVTSRYDDLIRSGGIALDNIVASVSDAAKLSLVFVDACRNDPRVTRGGGRGRGLARIADVVSESLFVGLSTRLGDTADDGDAGIGSPFARAFAEHMPTPGLRLDDAFRRVRAAVLEETAGAQWPDMRDDLNPPLIVVKADPSSPVVPPPEPSQEEAAGIDLEEAVPPPQAERRLPLGWSYDPIVGHSQAVSSVAFSPSGQVIATRAHDGTIKLWDAQTCELLRTLEDSFAGFGRSIAFSPDGHTIAVVSQKPNAINLWDARNGALSGSLDDIATSVAFSPDGRTIVSRSLDETVKLWEVHTGTLLRTYGRSSSGRTSEEMVEGLFGFLAYFGALAGDREIAVSPDGQRIASTSGQAIHLWDTGTGALIRTLKGHTERVVSVAFSGDGKAIASGDHDRTVRLWDVPTGALIRTIEGALDPFLASMALSPDGLVMAAGSEDGTVKLWDTRTGALVHSLEGDARVASIAFSPDGEVIAAGLSDNSVKLWAAETGVLGCTLGGHRRAVDSAAFSPDGLAIATGYEDGTVNLWSARLGTLIREFEGHENGIRSIAFSPDGEIVAAAVWDKTINLWDTRNGSLLRSLDEDDWNVSSIAFSPDGRTLAGGSGQHSTSDTPGSGTILLWEVTGAGSSETQSGSSGVHVRTIEGHSEPVSAVAFGPDGRSVASGSSDKAIKVWDVQTRALIHTLEGHDNGVASVAFSPDGHILASGSWDNTVKLWDAKTGALQRTLKGHSSSVNSVAFGPDGQVIASASWDKEIKLWDAASGALIGALEGHADTVSSIAFSPDGRLIVSGSQDRTARLWDVRSRRTLATFVGYGGGEGASVYDGALWTSSEAVDAFISVRRPDGWQLPLTEYEATGGERWEPPAFKGSIAVQSAATESVALVDPEELTRDLQSELKRVGCYAGAIDGIWGRGSQGGMAEFAKVASFEAPVMRPQDDPSQFAVLLDRLREHDGRACAPRCNARQQLVNGKCVTKTCPAGQTLQRDGSCRAAEARRSSETPAAQEAAPPPSGDDRGCLQLTIGPQTIVRCP